MRHRGSIGKGLAMGLLPMVAVAAMGVNAQQHPGESSSANQAATTPPMTDIHDILPPVPVGLDTAWLIPMLLALATIAVLATAWWFWKKRQRLRTIATIVPELPPELTAIQALDAIADVRRLDGKIFYFRLSAILRQYVHGRFAVGAPEMTTEEFVPCIERLNVGKELAQRIKRLCRAMEPIKFGGEAAMEKQMEADLCLAREFVTKTTPSTAGENHIDGGKPAVARAQMVS